MENTFLKGNEIIEAAIENFYKDSSKDAITEVTEAIRQRMHADGHLIFPVVVDEEDENRFAFRTIKTKDGKVWDAAFTSEEEFKKGAPSQILSNFIDSTLKFCMQSEGAGLVINPWGKSFFLTKDLINAIFEADGDIEYSVPEDPITPELLEGGSFLKRAIEICNRNRTQLNLIKLARILRDSFVWIPCNAVLSDADYEAFSKVVMDAQEKGDLDSLVGTTMTSHDNIRLIPDILQNGDKFFFPVFSSAAEMGEYGDRFSKIEKHFLEAVNLARNNEKDLTGIVINAFSEPFVIPKELFEIIENMESSISLETK